jgi:hypothetical protein
MSSPAWLRPGQPAFGGTLYGAPDPFIPNPDQALHVLPAVLDEFVAQVEDVQLFRPLSWVEWMGNRRGEEDATGEVAPRSDQRPMAPSRPAKDTQCHMPGNRPGTRPICRCPAREETAVATKPKGSGKARLRWRPEGLVQRGADESSNAASIAERSRLAKVRFTRRRAILGVSADWVSVVSRPHSTEINATWTGAPG